MAVDIPYPGAYAPKLVQGVIVNTPGSVGAALYVRIPSFNSSDQWRARNWEPHGATLPAAGKACLVAFDEENGAWVISWVA